MSIPDTLRKVHYGRNIERIREIRGIKQETLAQAIGITQQAVSKMEQSKEIDEDKLQKIAEALGVTVDAIRSFSEEAAIYNIQNNSETSSNNTIVNYQFNPIEKIVELYERLLKEKEDTIQALRKQSKKA